MNYWPPERPLTAEEAWKECELHLQRIGDYAHLAQVRKTPGVDPYRWAALTGELGLMPLPEDLVNFYAYKDGIGGVWPGERDGCIKRFRLLSFDQIVEILSKRIDNRYSGIDSGDELEETLPPNNENRKRLSDGGWIPIMVLEGSDLTDDIQNMVYIDSNPGPKGQIHQIAMVRRPDYDGIRSRIIAPNWTIFVETHLLLNLHNQF